MIFDRLLQVMGKRYEPLGRIHGASRGMKVEYSVGDQLGFPDADLDLRFLTPQIAAPNSFRQRRLSDS